MAHIENRNLDNLNKENKELGQQSVNRGKRIVLKKIERDMQS